MSKLVLFGMLSKSYQKDIKVKYYKWGQICKITTNGYQCILAQQT